MPVVMRQERRDLFDRNEQLDLAVTIGRLFEERAVDRFDDDAVPVTANATGMFYDAPVTGEAGFTMTFATSDGLTQDGSFDGLVTDGNATYAVAGTFAACARATE